MESTPKTCPTCAGSRVEYICQCDFEAYEERECPKCGEWIYEEDCSECDGLGIVERGEENYEH